MVITTAFLSAGTNPVLHNGHYGIFAPAQIGAVFGPSGLHTGDKALGNVAGQSGVFTVGAAAALHQGRGSNVNLGSQHHGDTGCTVLLGILLADCHSQLRVKGGSQGQGLHNAGLTIGVDGDHGGQSIGQLLAQLLNQVNPLGVLDIGFLVAAQVAGNAAAATAHDIFHTLGVGLGAAEGIAVIGKGAPTAVSQVRSNFFAAHLVDQVMGTGFVAFTPVFVDIQLAILVQVLKSKAVNLQQLDTGSLGVTQGLAALVGNQHPAVGGFGFGPLCAVSLDALHTGRENHGSSQHRGEHSVCSFHSCFLLSNFAFAGGQPVLAELSYRSFVKLSAFLRELHFHFVNCKQNRNQYAILFNGKICSFMEGLTI